MMAKGRQGAAGLAGSALRVAVFCGASTAVAIAAPSPAPRAAPPPRQQVQQVQRPAPAPRPYQPTYTRPVPQTQNQAPSQYGRPTYNGAPRNGYPQNAYPQNGYPQNGSRVQNGYPAAGHEVPAVVHPSQMQPQHVHAVVHPYSGVAARQVHLEHGRIGDVRVYRALSRYHTARYRTMLDVRYARDPAAFHGYWNDGWYHGYWHEYWDQESWITFQDHYGFWIDLDGVSTFVYESAPGECMYWNGYVWVPWYDPPETPYGCPY